MPSADQVPVKSSHSRMRWHVWGVPITGSTGSALRAVRPPNFHIPPGDRRDLIQAASATGEILHDLGSMQEAGRAYQRALDRAADDPERCTAWIGLAAVKRVIDDLAGALAELEQAETAATRHHL